MYQTFDKLGFKPGDTVKCTKSNLPKVYEVGKIYELEKHDNRKRTITCEGFNGFSAEWEKVETEMKFKVGDKVKIVENRSSSTNEVGDIGIITKIWDTNNAGDCKVIVAHRENCANWHKQSDLELYTEVEYEDQWHLNDGKVTIPDDADKLEKDGSVVAFRKRKPPEFKFGDMVKTKSGNICIVVGKDQEGLYRVIGENMVHSVTIFTDSLTKI